MSLSPGVRFGYTMIEVIAAMAASSLLLLALASSVAISTSLVEPTLQSEGQQRDRMIFDRLSHDLRYANAISSASEYSFTIGRHDLSDVLQTLTYEAYDEGLTRRVDDADAIQLEATTPAISHFVDGYSAPTPFYQVLPPRIRDVSTAETGSNPASSMTIDVPDAALPGDLLILAIAYRNSFYAFPNSSDWDLQSFRFNTDIALVVYWQLMDSSTAAAETLSFNYDGDVTASMLALENANVDSPFLWLGSATGTSTIGNAATFPQPLENTGATGIKSLSLQLFAAAGSPTPQTSLGVASLSDCVNLVGSRWSDGECALGIGFRTGPIPSLSSVPHVLHQQSAHWVTIGIEIGGTNE